MSLAHLHSSPSTDLYNFRTDCYKINYFILLLTNSEGKKISSYGTGEKQAMIFRNVFISKNYPRRGTMNSKEDVSVPRGSFKKHHTYYTLPWLTKDPGI